MNETFFVDRDDAGRNRFQQRFCQGFLQGNLFIEQGVLQNRGNMFGQDHQSFEVAVLKG